ncbi:MAG: hypothetical protein IPP44_24965 [Ideonella sp.]|nr:hypothetical protein [Ideonella sp.]
MIRIALLIVASLLISATATAQKQFPNGIMVGDCTVVQSVPMDAQIPSCGNEKISRMLIQYDLRKVTLKVQQSGPDKALIAECTNSSEMCVTEQYKMRSSAECSGGSNPLAQHWIKKKPTGGFEIDAATVQYIQNEKAWCDRPNQPRKDSSNNQEGSRQLCEAQKATCLASCPSWVSGANNDNHFRCNSRCNALTCR